MSSREELARFADTPARMVRPTFPMTEEERDLFKKGLCALDRIRAAGAGDDAAEGGWDDGSLVAQLEAATVRSAELEAALDAAMGAIAALEAAGLRLSVKRTSPGMLDVTVTRCASSASGAETTPLSEPDFGG